jgi:FixJ family two-component response regulator
MIFKVPLFSYPTTVGLVDNDNDFTKTLRRCLNSVGGHPLIETFNTADEVISFASQKARHNHLLDSLISPLDEDVTENYTSNFDIRTLYNAVYDKDRHKNLSVLIMDYAMPNMTGLDVFEQINIPGMQKILLTGVADESIAITAFNQGLIDGYIKKHDIEMLAKVNATLEASFNRYFLELSRPFETYIDAEDLKKNPLTHDAFRDHFNELIKAHEIEEYYLLQSTGSYLLIDKNKNLKGLYAYGEDFVEVLLESRESETAEASVLKELEHFKQVLCYYDPACPSVPQGDLWPKYLRPATKIPLKEGACYTAVTDLLFDLDTKRLELLPIFGKELF